MRSAEACRRELEIALNAEQAAPTDVRVGVAVRAAAWCALCSAISMRSDQDATRCMQMALNAAQRAAQSMDEADYACADGDYHRLLELFGAHDSFVVGEPFDAGIAGPLGPITRSQDP
jgi:hypothetical protein